MGAPLTLADLTETELRALVAEAGFSPKPRDLLRARWRSLSATWMQTMEDEGRAMDAYLAAYGRAADAINAKTPGAADLAREAITLRDAFNLLSEARRAARKAERAAWQDLQAA